MAEKYFDRIWRECTCYNKAVGKLFVMKDKPNSGNRRADEPQKHDSLKYDKTATMRALR